MEKTISKFNRRIRLGYNSFNL